MPIMNDIRATLDGALADLSNLPSIAFENAPFSQIADRRICARPCS